MEQFNYRLVSVGQTLIASFPLGTAGDGAVITIYDVDDAATDFNAVAMTNINATDWKYAWTPTQTNMYLVTYRNPALDVSYKEFIKVVGSLVGVPGGAGTGSTLATLRTRFLKMVDNYNLNDLSGDNTSGDVADLYLNEALQTIYSDIKNSRYMDGYTSAGLISTIDQSYIELSAISDLDELFAIRDTTNDYTLVEIPKWRYFLEVPDPANSTGTPYRYCRIFNRIYLDPRPTAVITYQTDYKKTYARLSSDSDVALIPSKFDKWIYDEAWVTWLRGEDSGAIGAIQLAMAERERTKDIFLSDIGSQFARASQLRSQFGTEGRVNYWQRLGIND